MSEKSNPMIPLMTTLGFVVAGLVICAIGGFGNGSIAGGLIAGAGIIPACWAIYAGFQQESQGPALLGILLFLFALAASGLMILLRFVDWLR